MWPLAAAAIGAARRTDAGIDDDDVDRSVRKIPIRRCQERRLLRRMSYERMSCVMSTSCTSGAMPRMTPFMIPTKGSRRPKSVVKVIIMWNSMRTNLSR